MMVVTLFKQCNDHFLVQTFEASGTIRAPGTKDQKQYDIMRPTTQVEVSIKTRMGFSWFNPLFLLGPEICMYHTLEGEFF